MAALTDTNNDVKRTYEYDRFGALIEGGDQTQLSDKDRARFKGSLAFDEFGMQYMRNRWYDPGSGRIVSEDPIGVKGGINVYAFGGADPVNKSDPTGLWCKLVNAGGDDESLYCEDVTSLDLWVIDDYLGDLDEHDVFATLSGAIGGLRSVCGRWNPTACANIRRALSALVLHGDRVCSALGGDASKRFQKRQIRPNAHLAERRRGAWALPLPFGHGLTDLAPGDIEAGNYLASVIAHEERHHDWGGKLRGFIPWWRIGHPSNDPYLIQAGPSHPCS